MFRCRQCVNPIFTCYTKDHLIQHFMICKCTKKVIDFSTFNKWRMIRQTGNTDILTIEDVDILFEEFDRRELYLVVKNPRKSKAIEPKRLSNPEGNRWAASRAITISQNGLDARTNAYRRQCTIFAEMGFFISAPPQQAETMIFYYEVELLRLERTESMFVGYSNGTIPDGTHVGNSTNSYSLQNYQNICLLSGVEHLFVLPESAQEPTWSFIGHNTIGSGLMLSPDNKLHIFFTLNGNLMGKKIPIAPEVDHLIPTVSIRRLNTRMELLANFGYTTTRNFKYNTKRCPGLVFD